MTEGAELESDDDDVSSSELSESLSDEDSESSESESESELELDSSSCTVPTSVTGLWLESVVFWEGFTLVVRAVEEWCGSKVRLTRLGEGSEAAKLLYEHPRWHSCVSTYFPPYSCAYSSPWGPA